MHQDNFKLTKIGWLPKEWEVNEIIKVADYVDYRGKTPTKVNEGIFLLTAKNIKDGYIDYECSKEYIATNTYNEVMRRGLPQIGDVLITTEAPLGKVAQIDKVGIALAQRIIKYRAKKNKLNNDFLKFYLGSDKFQKELDEKSTGSTAKGIKGSQLHQMLIGLPPLAEQQKIASILRGCDAVIDKTQALITALQKRHKGLMQQLLTGKKRVAGFEKGKWKIERFGDIFERVVQKNEKNCQNVLTISAQQGLINQEDFFKKQIASDSFLHYYLLKKGDFAYNKSYSNGYPFGAFKRLNKYEEGILSPLYICFKLNESKGDSDFWVYFFESGGMNQGVCDIAQEGARNHGLLNIGIADFFNIEIKVPPTLSEQQKIAEILRGSEKEIALYEKQLAALKQQKRGLMQVLLTGRVRVKVN